MMIIRLFSALVMTVNPGVGISVLMWKYVCACGPTTVELKMVGLKEVIRKEMNIDGGFCVGYGSAPKIEGWGTVFVVEGFAAVDQPLRAYGLNIKWNNRTKLLFTMLASFGDYSLRTR